MAASLALFLKYVGLAMRLKAAVPTLPIVDAYEHASAAVEASTDHVRPELLLAIAFVESRFDVTATSRVEGHRRRTGHYAPTTPPDALNRRGTLYCGPLQTFASSWDECMSMRSLSNAYAAGAAELEHWLKDRRVHGDLTLALAGHGCGNHGVRTGKCNHYSERVLWIQRRFALPVDEHGRLEARRAPRS